MVHYQKNSGDLNKGRVGYLNGKNVSDSQMDIQTTIGIADIFVHYLNGLTNQEYQIIF